ncbi:MAG: putative glycosyltransferase, partial [Marmoricola sp.]|nr:putative glycosyltransferase [Marmoricola sp.]
MATKTGTATVRRVLQRFVLPADRDLDVVPLYVDTEDAMLDADKETIGTNQTAQKVNKAASRQAISSGTSLHPDAILDRHRLRVEASSRISLGTYFNGFPASYWRRWTIVDEVRLDLTLSGAGASVIVYRSMANGRSQRVDGWTCETEGPSSASFDLTLTPFVDGGWYWFDVVAGDEAAVIEEATWTAEVPDDRAEVGSVTVGITTMNRPDFCAALIAQVGEDADVNALVDEVLVMEQGTQKVADSEFFPAAQAALGDRLRMIEQGNLGGSGGYARGQLESLRKGTATYALMMDDDVVCEPEGIMRAVVFGDLCHRPTIVGGHMFSLYARSRLHS